MLVGGHVRDVEAPIIHIQKKEDFVQQLALMAHKERNHWAIKGVVTMRRLSALTD
jgi:hypothetical protein